MYIFYLFISSTGGQIKENSFLWFMSGTQLHIHTPPDLFLHVILIAEAAVKLFSSLSPRLTVPNIALASQLHNLF
jgi:hypothetical protein